MATQMLSFYFYLRMPPLLMYTDVPTHLLQGVFLFSSFPFRVSAILLNFDHIPFFLTTLFSGMNTSPLKVCDSQLSISNDNERPLSHLPKTSHTVCTRRFMWGYIKSYIRITLFAISLRHTTVHWPGCSAAITTSMRTAWWQCTFCTLRTCMVPHKLVLCTRSIAWRC